MRTVPVVALAAVLVLPAPASATTTFSFGGYAKLDVLSTYYFNGDVAPESPLRDFHLPSQIPVGPERENHDLDFHVKESRFNLGTTTTIEDFEIRGFVELDFLLSKQGDEKVSNSFNPRLRHYYLSTNSWLFGQTWTTFMIVVIPDELDFTGAAEGIVFARQPQIRFSRGSWKISLENPEAIVSGHQTTESAVTESGRLPELVARYDFAWERATLGVAALGRQIFYKVVEDDGSVLEDRGYGYGLTAGSRIRIGKRDDIRVMGTIGRGLGRYVALNFINDAVLGPNGEINPLGSMAGYIALRHFWTDRLRSSFSASAFAADNPDHLVAAGANQEAQSYSGNLLYSPVDPLTIGAELMYARRVVADGTDGSFLRLQLSARYDFGFTGS